MPGYSHQRPHAHVAMDKGQSVPITMDPLEPLEWAIISVHDTTKRIPGRRSDRYQAFDSDLPHSQASCGRIVSLGGGPAVCRIVR
jgi:hypothetical protein